MKIVLAITALILIWLAWYQLLSRVMFRSRLKRWKYQEDMINEGSQTSLILLLSGILGLVTLPFFAFGCAWLISQIVK